MGAPGQRRPRPGEPRGNLRICQNGPVSKAIEETLRDLAPRLRTLRKRAGVTLAELSAASDIAVSTLSRLEAGRRLPTLGQVLAPAEACAVSIDELIGAPPTGDARVNLRPVVRNGKTLIPLTRRPGGIQAYKLIPPSEGPDQEMVLAPGEAAEFDTRVLHWFGAASPDRRTSSHCSATRVNARTCAPPPSPSNRPDASGTVDVFVRGRPEQYEDGHNRFDDDPPDSRIREDPVARGDAGDVRGHRGPSPP